MERGAILYDSSKNPEMVKLVQNKIKNNNISAYLFFGMSVVFILFVIIDIKQEDKVIKSLVTFGSAVVVSLIVGLGLILETKSIKLLKVYENGIEFPETTALWTLKKIENYCPFSKLRTIYINTWDRRYVTILGDLEISNGIGIKKEYIYNMKKFINVLEGKIEIVDEYINLREWRKRAKMNEL